MKIYDSSKPLIMIHIPKAGGTTAREIFQRWFGAAFFQHYFNEQEGTMPLKRDLFSINSEKKPLLLYGHFNRLRQFGVEDYYPKVNQFITILRDPFDLTVSRFFYARKNTADWKDRSRVPQKSLRKFLLHAKPNMLNHFPREVTQQNYRDLIEEYFFIEVGITEYLDESLRRIAQKLNRPYDPPTKLGFLNATVRDEKVPKELKDQFMERNQLEYLVYNYALKKHTEYG